MNIADILERASSLRIAVVGDYIEDRYIIGEMTRISPEAPVPIVKIKETRTAHGGAGNVLNNIMNLVDFAYLFRDVKTGTVKTRVMVDNHHILRIDEESDPVYRELSSFHWGETLLQGISKNEYDCVVISDYHKGVVSYQVAQSIIFACNLKNIPVVVDAKKDFHKFKNATVLKCNKQEAKDITHSAMVHELRLVNFIVTMGEIGMSLYYDNGREGFAAKKVDSVDVCGAGDTVTAILAIMVALKYPIGCACELANAAAAEACRHPGVYAITKKDLLNLTL